VSSSMLYLDTARLGLMSPTAQRAHREFARFAGEEGCPLYFEEFLRRGFQTRPDFFAAHYPGLCCWLGIAELKQELRRLTGSPFDLPVLLANRSAQLMKLAARLLFLPCENVLVTDLGWPAYRAILEAERKRTPRQVTELAVREAILRNGADEDAIVSLFCSEFRRSECDGLFLTAVSHEGVRLPVERIVTELEAKAEVRFVVIDGAQAFCHTATDLRHGAFDLYVAGSHKWLEAYHPLGLAFYGKMRSRQLIETIREKMLRCGDLDDPLLRFTEQLESEHLDGCTETVNIASLLSCAGAVQDANKRGRALDEAFQIQLNNAHSVAEAADGLKWQPAQPTEPFQSGILILESRRYTIRNAPASVVREAFQREGLAVTSYDGGALRLSMPRNPLAAAELNRIRMALQHVS